MKNTVYILIAILFLSSCKKGNEPTPVINNNNSNKQITNTTNPTSYSFYKERYGTWLYKNNSGGTIDLKWIIKGDTIIQTTIPHDTSMKIQIDTFIVIIFNTSSTPELRMTDKNGNSNSYTTYGSTIDTTQFNITTIPPNVSILNFVKQ